MEEDKNPILLEDLGMMFATENSKKKSRFGLYKCGYCGKEFKACISRVKGNYTRSCGCQQYRPREKSVTHNLSKHRLYSTWVKMNHRCNNINNKDYHSYGGRGIKVCEEWKDVKNFIEWGIGYFNILEEAVQARDNYIIDNNLPHKLSSEYKKEK